MVLFDAIANVWWQVVIWAFVALFLFAVSSLAIYLIWAYLLKTLIDELRNPDTRPALIVLGIVILLVASCIGSFYYSEAD